MNASTYKDNEAEYWEQEVTKRKNELEQAQKDVENQLRQSPKKLMELMEDHPDLLEDYQTIEKYRCKDLDEKMAELANKKKCLTQQYEAEKRELEKTYERENPFRIPCQLVAKSDYLEWLIQELEKSSKAKLEELLRNPRLEQQDWDKIHQRWKSLPEPKLVPFHVSFQFTRKDLKKEDSISANLDSDWVQYIQELRINREKIRKKQGELRVKYNHQMEEWLEQRLKEWRVRLEKIESELNESKKAKLKEGEVQDYLKNQISIEVNKRTQAQQEALNEAKRKWEEARWNNIEHWNLSELISQLENLPHNRVLAALERILRLEENDPNLHDEKVQKFLQSNYSRRQGQEVLLSPVIVALLGRLAIENSHEARKLLKELPTTSNHRFAQVVSYLKFVVNEKPQLTGYTSFESLDEEDVYLGACYWEKCPEKLYELTTWKISSVINKLRQDSGAEDSRSINNFKVQGLQPRIAELAFRRVYRDLQGAEKDQNLCDLNVKVVKSLPRPWSLKLRPKLPGADWRDQDGKEYDVKCNLYFRSKNAKEGLRGLLIHMKDSNDKNHYYPAFIFYDSDDEGCYWCYVGTYLYKEKCKVDRVSPFLFCLPKQFRFSVEVDKAKSHKIAEYFFKNEKLRLGWYLATRNIPSELPANDLICKVVSKCAEQKEMPLEEAIWRSTTEVTLEACSTSNVQQVCDFLDRMANLVQSRAFPLYLPRWKRESECQFDETKELTLFERWIKNVLKPIAENWANICCPQCQQTGNESGAIQLSDIYMTAEGSITARFKCHKCNHECDCVTVLTHCHGCQQYPLLIGKNRICEKCSGLICDGKKKDETCCRACKRKCPNSVEQKQSPNNHAANSSKNVEDVDVFF